MLEAEPHKPCFQVLDAVFEKGCAAMSGLDVCGKHSGRRAAKRSTHTAQLPLRTSGVQRRGTFPLAQGRKCFWDQKCLRSSSWEGEPWTHPRAEENSQAT